jgi:probable rRNA maturation factor
MLGKRRQTAALQILMIEIINRQRSHKIDGKAWRAFSERALAATAAADRTATIVFVSDAVIKRLNRQFRGQNNATDVLSFPTAAERFESANESSLGEIVISAQRAAAQARRNGLTFKNEVQQLILHGLLHLCGYDHETDSGEMNRLELKLRRKLGI